MSIRIHSPKNFQHCPQGLIVITGHSSDHTPVTGVLLQIGTANLPVAPAAVHIKPNGNFVVFFADVKPGLYSATVFHPDLLSLLPTACLFSVSPARARKKAPTPPTISTPTSGDDPLETLTPSTGGACSAVVNSVYVTYTDDNGDQQRLPGKDIESNNQYWSADFDFTVQLTGLTCACTHSDGTAVAYTEYAVDANGRTSQPDSGLQFDPRLCQTARSDTVRGAARRARRTTGRTR